MPEETIMTEKLEDTAYLLALNQMDGLGPRVAQDVLNHFGCGEAVWHASEFELRKILKPKVFQTLLKTRETLKPKEHMARYTDLGIHIIGITSPDYPPLLREIYDPPIVLFVRGNLNALVGNTLAIVGTRRITEYGRKVTRFLIEGMKDSGVTLVSGLAEGVDGCAHQAALDYDLPTVAVFGCGIDLIFPRRHERLALDILKSDGALVSEYPLGYPGSKNTFPRRNRIISGLSYGALVVEGNLKSGSLITARYATEENRSVYTVPGNIFRPQSQGPSYLLKQGAIPVTDASDILNDLNWAVDKNGETEQQLNVLNLPTFNSTEESKVYSCIDVEPVPINSLVHQTDYSSAKISEILTLLELGDYVEILPGNRVCRK